VFIKIFSADGFEEVSKAADSPGKWSKVATLLGNRFENFYRM